MDNQIPPHGLPPINSADKPKRNNRWIYLAIILLLLVTNILLFTNKDKTDKQLANTESQLEFHQVENENLQIQYGAALKKLDELAGQNASLENIVKDKNSELNKFRARIESILKNKNATDKELAEARSLISKLNNRISGYEQQIAELKTQNKNLSKKTEEQQEEIQTLYEEKEIFEEQLEDAKVFSASKISIQAINLRKNGQKSVQTSRAKRADILRVRFDINENRVAESGTQTFYIRILDPKGQILSNATLGSGKFTIRDHGEEQYTISKTLQINPAVVVRDIIVDWEESDEYEKGSYTVQLYHEGFLIGEGVTRLR